MLLFALCTVLVTYRYGVHSAVFTASEEESINTFISKMMECRHIPGLTVAVVRGSEDWTRGFGKADLDSQRDVDEETLFSFGSIGKAFTMTLLGNILEDTEYDWTTRLSDIEGLNIQFPSRQLTENVTLKDLLSHRTGLSAIADYGYIAGYPDGTDSELLSRRLTYVPEVAEYGSSFVYNNMMYMVLGYVTEFLGGDKWPNLMTSRLLEPIGMESSKITHSAEDMESGNVAKPYIYKDDRYQAGDSNIYVLHPLEPAGSVMSNAVDMVKWIKFNLNNATTASGKRLLDPARFTQAFQFQNDIGYFGSMPNVFPVDMSDDGYGFAWFTSTYRGYKRNWHSGGLFSYVSLIWLFPDEDIGLCISVNGPAIPSIPGRGLTAALSFISDILLKLEPWLNTDSGCTYPSPWRNDTTFPYPPPKKYTNDNLDDFVGSYGSHLLPNISIDTYTNEDGNKSLLLNWNQIKGDLLPTPDDTKFKFQMTMPWEYAIERKIADNAYVTYLVAFNRDANDTVDSFIITFSAKEKMEFWKNVTFLEVNNAEDDTNTGGDTSRGAPSYTGGNYVMSLICITQVAILILYCSRKD